jgi:hypothetical protein
VARSIITNCKRFVIDKPKFGSSGVPLSK